MKGPLLYALLFAILAAAALAAGAAVHYFRPRPKQVARQAAGSRIALSVGDRFAPSDRFTGFVHEESGASIVLMELPAAAFDQLQKLGNAEETFEAQGVSSVRQLTLPDRSGDYIYLRGEQNTALVEYSKHILIFREGGITGMVTANIPRAALTAGIVTDAEIEAILSSATLRASVQEGPKLFTLAYLGPFEEDLSLLGTTKGYRLKSSQSEGPGNGLQPFFLVAPSLTQARIPNLSFFAERAFEGIDQLRDKSLETTHKLEIAGLQAIETYGHGTDIGTGIAALVYQLVLEMRHGGYFRLVGLAPDSARDDFLPEFRKMAASFHPAD